MQVGYISKRYEVSVLNSLTTPSRFFNGYAGSGCSNSTVINKNDLVLGSILNLVGFAEG